jgi:hypothetical protein
VDSTPDSHLDSSMFGKHSSATNGTNNCTVNPEPEHCNIQNTHKLTQSTVWCDRGLKIRGTFLGEWPLIFCRINCHLQGQAVQ